MQNPRHDLPQVGALGPNVERRKAEPNRTVEERERFETGDFRVIAKPSGDFEVVRDARP